MVLNDDSGDGLPCKKYTGATRTRAHREVLYGFSSDLSSVERGELCQDQCMVLPLTDYMQDVGEAHARRGVQAPYLSAGFGDL